MTRGFLPTDCPQLIQTNAQLLQNRNCRTARRSQNRTQKMFCSGKAATIFFRKCLCLLHNFTQRRGEAVLLHLCRNPSSDQFHQRISHPLCSDVLGCQHCCSSIAALLQQSQQQMFTADVSMSQFFRRTDCFFQSKNGFSCKPICISHTPNSFLHSYKFSMPQNLCVICRSRNAFLHFAYDVL